ncbi:hypothetical protein WH50_16785 [Pokkaliibacter plantistimulans]|uniref:DUF4149 domain-containing protein n=2 Tax=Pokkaliibacter plantistimulans TaxID=1635171 RepID=A0ABX5LU37_9GAMM|nr:hypothetical protein WH50_16785 [Pokkaliibacter plantistimulans]
MQTLALSSIAISSSNLGTILIAMVTPTLLFHLFGIALSRWHNWKLITGTVIYLPTLMTIIEVLLVKLSSEIQNPALNQLKHDMNYGRGFAVIAAFLLIGTLFFVLQKHEKQKTSPTREKT